MLVNCFFADVQLACYFIHRSLVKPLFMKLLLGIRKDFVPVGICLYFICQETIIVFIVSKILKIIFLFKINVRIIILKNFTLAAFEHIIVCPITEFLKLQNHQCSKKIQLPHRMKYSHSFFESYQTLFPAVICS